MNDVRLAREVERNLASRGGLQIDGQALFAALHAKESTELRSAHRVAAVLLDLDYPRAKVRKQAISEGPRHIGAKVEHQESVEWADASRRCVGRAIGRRRSVATGPRASLQEQIVLAGRGHLAAKLDRRATIFGELSQHPSAIRSDLHEAVLFHLLEP